MDNLNQAARNTRDAKFNKSLKDFDILHEACCESLFDSDLYFSLLQAISSGSNDDLMAYAENQIISIKGYIANPSRSNRGIN